MAFRVKNVLPGGRLTGTGYIAGESPGLVSVAGSPAARRVFLLERNGMQVTRSTISAADGTYRFSHIDAGRRYCVVAIDHQLQFNAVIRDNIAPVNE